MKHLVLFSGGIGSWAAAKRVAERHGTDDLLLLFTDTRMEDEDTYRFLNEAAANVGGEFVTIADGRTPWELFEKARFIANSRVDKCSETLKRDLSRRWIKERFQPDEVTIYLGIDWTEEHRFKRARERWLPYTLECPLCEPPYLLKPQLHQWAEREGLRKQRLYEMGMQHANCGGFCVKAGQGHFAHLLKVMPERYAYHEEQEERLRGVIGKDVSIMKDRRGGVTKPLTLKDFREEIEAQPQQMSIFDALDWGGCGCMVDED